MKMLISQRRTISIDGGTSDSEPDFPFLRYDPCRSVASNSIEPSEPRLHMEPFEKIYDADYDPCDSDSVRGSDSSDECLEDFENEMQDELDRRVGLKRGHKRTHQQNDTTSISRESGERPGTAGGASKSSGPDEESGNPLEDSAQSPTEDANGEAFYDPDEDEDNERWAQRQRQRHIYPDADNPNLPLPKSDAVLNCPGCMTVLCRDCQAHETKAGQYRAMFVTNCKADATVEVPGPLVKKRAARKRRRGDADPEVDSEDGMVFHPFHCDFCQTRVGVVDSDEVYHFLYVLAS